jgi:ATP-binding cassette subfamily B protein
MKQLKALNKYFWKYRIRLGIGALFIIISNYFAVLVPQVTRFIIDHVQKSIDATQNISRPVAAKHDSEYDFFVLKFIKWVEADFSQRSDLSKIVILCGITIYCLHCFVIFYVPMRQTIIVMSRHIEYDQKMKCFSITSNLIPRFTKHTAPATDEPHGRRCSKSENVHWPRNYVSYQSCGAYFIEFILYAEKDVELTVYVLAPLPILAVTIYYVNSIINKRSERYRHCLPTLQQMHKNRIPVFVL